MSRVGKSINVVDLFCGTGAIAYGMSKYDPRFVVRAGIDIDSSACQTARFNHPKAKIVCESIATMAPIEFEKQTGISQVDLIVGGPPCQGFSSLRPNRRSNVMDPRNQLFTDFLSYVKYFEPKAILMENVVGILSDKTGDTVNQIINGFNKIGYAVDWRVLNAANFGVPQKRERFILIGFRKEGNKKLDLRFPEPTHFFSGRVIGTRLKSHYVVNEHVGLPAITVFDAISDLPSLRSGEETNRYLSPPQNDYQKERRQNAENFVTLHVAAKHSEKMQHIMSVARGSKLDLPEGLVTSGFSSCYSRMAANEPATTITVKFTSPASSKCIHPYQDRAITPREAARLQGFDDNFVFAGSKTDIASQIGNAVPPLLGTALAPLFIEQLS